MCDTISNVSFLIIILFDGVNTFYLCLESENVSNYFKSNVIRISSQINGINYIVVFLISINVIISALNSILI